MHENPSASSKPPDSRSNGGVKSGQIHRLLVKMAMLINPPWTSDETELSMKLNLLVGKLCHYELDDVDAVLNQWTDENSRWPAWADLKKLLDERVFRTAPRQIGKVSGALSSFRRRRIAELLRSQLGRQAMREGWAPTLVLDAEAGKFDAQPPDDGYAAKQSRLADERRAAVVHLDAAKSPLDKALAKLGQAVDERSLAMLAENAA